MNNLQEAYLSIYQEALDPEERALRRAEVADKKASRMDAKVAAKYAGSEAKSAEREDKKSKGKHIHGMADSVELDGDLVDEGTMDIKGFEIPKKERDAARERTLAKAKEMKNKKKIRESSEDLEEKRGLWDNIHAKRKRGERPAKPGEKGYPKTLNVEELDQIIEGIRQARKNVGASKCWTGKKLGNPSTKMKGGKEVPNCVDEAVYGGEKKEPEDKRMVVTKADKIGNTKAYQNYKAGHKGYKAADHLGERALDPTEKAEKERIVKGMKKSAAGFKERYGKRAKEVMYATATARAKERMDTSKSDRRYGVEK
jgi:hypothetical protein